MIWLLMTGGALAQGPDVHSEVSSFFFGSWSDHPVLTPDGTAGMGAVNGRLLLDWEPTRRLKLTAHPALSAATTAAPWMQTGTGKDAPEAIDMSWQPEDSDGLEVLARVDWLHLRAQGEGLAVTLGRQPIGFGTGTFFTPMDLVSPFGLTTVDTSHRPGVDAARIDSFFGTGGRISAVAAYAGDWDLDGMILLTEGQATLGVTDLHALLGEVRGEHVVGLGLATSAGPVGLHGDATLTLPDTEDAFVRAVVGADWRPTERTTLSSEAYLQTIGGSDPADYIELAMSDRFGRGEIQQLGQYYLGAAIQQELTPLVHGSLSGFANLEDKSMMLSPALRCSVADNAELNLGGFFGLGESDLKSEFGMLPPTVFLQMRSVL